MTINILPDNIFREVFALCLGDRTKDPNGHVREWQRLVNVCQRWRQIVYESPRYLDLHLHCSSENYPHHMSFRKCLRRWPDFPLAVNWYVEPDLAEDDLFAALEHPNRVHSLDLVISWWRPDFLEKMQVSFPALTHLELDGPPDPEHDEELIDISDNFLGNAAPSCLQYLYLKGIVFQELPKFLLSACGLVSLRLEGIPALGCHYNRYYRYISPQSMVGVLAGLTRLRTFRIGFQLPHPEDSDPPDSDERGRSPEPLMRTVLPALTEFVFDGESKYLEDLVALVDMPSIEDIKTTYFSREPRSPEFQVRQLSQFIGRTANLELAQFRGAQVIFDVWYSRITLDRPQGERHRISFSLAVQIPGLYGAPYLGFLVPCMTRLLEQLGQLTTLLSDVGHLFIKSRQHWDDDFNWLDDSELLPLLYLFPTVEELHVSGALAELIATMLERIAEERVTEVMPALHSLWLKLKNGDSPIGSMERFLSLRQLSGRPVTVGNMQDKAVG